MVKWEHHMNILVSTWDFKQKTFPDTRLKELKYTFFIIGYQQIKGANCFDTYEPVFYWYTV